MRVTQAKMMKCLFSFKKKKAAPPPPSVEEAYEKMYKRGDVINENIKKLDTELCIYKEQFKKARVGPSQNAIKARAMHVLKHKKLLLLAFTGFLKHAIIDSPQT